MAVPALAQERRGAPRRQIPDAVAQTWGGPDMLIAREQDHDQARDGVNMGRFVPLSSVLADIRSRYPGKLLDARTVGNRYEIRWLTPDSRRLDITANARTGEILNVRGQ